MAYLHFDEASVAAANAVKTWLSGVAHVNQALLMRDLFGRFRLALWTSNDVDTASLTRQLAEGCGEWWTGEIILIAQLEEVSRELYENSSKQARRDTDEARLLLLDRHRTRTGWFADRSAALWDAAEGPPIVVFYSFKGGLGRSTLLSSFAIQRAQAGERVCVVDFDLDSPGVGRLLAADAEGLTARWGVVDFLVESSLIEAAFSDYYHRCDRVSGAGQIFVFPAGQIDHTYADKLARVDMEDALPAQAGALVKLLARMRQELNPHWVLLDARTGISDVAGPLLAGLAHLHVLIGTTQEQSWLGVGLILDRLGKQHIEKGQPQAEILLVQAMVPTGEAGKTARTAFAARAETEVSNRYYAAVPANEVEPDIFWTTNDIGTSDGPHVPIAVDYDARLADFRDIADIAESLVTKQYSELADRIVGRFVAEPEV